MVLHLSHLQLKSKSGQHDDLLYNIWRKYRISLCPSAAVSFSSLFPQGNIWNKQVFIRRCEDTCHSIMLSSVIYFRPEVSEPVCAQISVRGRDGVTLHLGSESSCQTPVTGHPFTNTSSLFKSCFQFCGWEEN